MPLICCFMLRRYPERDPSCGPSFPFLRSSASFVVRHAGRPVRPRPLPFAPVPRSAVPPCGQPPLVVEALWSGNLPLTRPREGGNVSPCRRARARREGEGRRPWARTLRTGYCERKIELKSSSDDSDGSDKLGPAS